MKKLKRVLRVSLLLLLICGIIYPLSLTAVSGVLFANQAKGSLIYENKEVIGSKIIGQDFSGSVYLQGRPSANNYGTDSDVSGSSNLNVSSNEYQEILQNRIDEFIANNPSVSAEMIPNDLIMESASGYDPHISYQGALIQIPRISEMTHLPEDDIRGIIDKNTKNDLVNVLEVNIAIKSIIE